MSVSSFDRFIAGLAHALASAQDACRRRRARLRRRARGTGDAQDAVSTHSPDDGPGQVPPSALAGLLHANTIGPSRLSVELDCDLRLLPPLHAGGPRRVAVCVGRGRQAHRLRIALHGQGALQGEVLLDGALLRRFTAGAPTAAGDTR